MPIAAKSALQRAKHDRMTKKELLIRITETTYDGGELTAEEKNLIDVSREMTEKAYAPYSGFCVGAAVLLEDGQIITGSNQENAAYPSGLCAERVAVFAASSMHPGAAMRALAISTRTNGLKSHNPVAPCGACRQVLLEYEEVQKKPIRLLLGADNGKVIVAEKIRDLLPLAFTGTDLGK